MPENVPGQPFLVPFRLAIRPPSQRIVVDAERLEIREPVEEPVRVYAPLVDRFEDQRLVFSEHPLCLARADRLHRFRAGDADVLGEDRLSWVPPRLADERARLEGRIVWLGPDVRCEAASEGEDALEHWLVESLKLRHLPTCPAQPMSEDGEGVGLNLRGDKREGLAQPPAMTALWKAAGRSNQLRFVDGGARRSASVRPALLAVLFLPLNPHQLAIRLQRPLLLDVLSMQ